MQKYELFKIGTERIVTYLAATGNINKIGRFQALGRVGFLLGTGNGIIHVERLDALISDEKITFMKLDVEGSELVTLKGTENIIKIRHHTYHIYDTVLYALSI